MQNSPETVVGTSKSVCPTCLDLIDCQILIRKEQVFQRKLCEKHGQFEEMIYASANDYLDAVKAPHHGSSPLHHQSAIEQGCPDDCGLCPAHEQHTCVGIIEITDHCDLGCPVCFANTKNSFMLSFEQVAGMIDLYVKCEGQPEVLQISGGEPTMHPEIFRILDYASQKGIKYLLLNTNGLRLADPAFAEQISQAIRSDNWPNEKPMIYLQFDGLHDDAYRALRGRPLLDIKMRAIENCREAGISVGLVPTIARGINEDQIGPIIDLALNDQNVKMVNFQPMTRTGRTNLGDRCGSQMTIPELLEKIEEQTAGAVMKASFFNLPCPHPTCSVCSYVLKDKEKTIELTKLLDVDKYISQMANRATPHTGLVGELRRSAQSLFSMSAIAGSNGIKEALCTFCGISIPNIRQMIDEVTMISAHAFMDPSNFDLDRARKCCITQILPNGKMIPFCVYNVLYRERLWPT